MRSKITLFLLYSFLMHPTLAASSAAQPAPAAQGTTNSRRAECVIGLCIGGTACTLVFGMLIAGWVDQPSASSHYNATTDSIAPSTLAAHASAFTLRSKAELNALQHAFKREQAKPNNAQIKMKFARHNYKEAKQRNNFKNKKQAKR
jgi:hypothetical protein